MESWIIWLILAAVLGAAEIMTTTLAFGLLAVAAGAAAIGADIPSFIAFQAIHMNTRLSRNSTSATRPR